MQVLFITALVLLLLLLPLILLRIISPGTTSPIRDTKGKLVSGSIAVIERVTIGGIEQVMIIRGHDVKNPVLLYLHGGPGTPEFAFIRKEFAELEKHFTICYWEQRGAGKSAKWKLPTEYVTLEQLVKDAGEVAVYLQQRFTTGRIYLLGHSWGTVLGAHTAKTYPELFAAYIGIGQVGDQFEGEKLSLEFVNDQAKQLQHTSVPEKIRKLQLPERNAPAHIWIPYLLAQRRWVAEFGGALFHTNMNKTAPRQLITCAEYTLREKLNFVTAAKHSMAALWEKVITENLAETITELRIPVYIIQGLHDYQTPTAEARKFYDQLTAPHKAWYEFDNAAHFPHTECYRQTETILLNDVLKPNQLNN